jgi:hypothetical protein
MHFMDATTLFRNHKANLHNISVYLEQGGDPAAVCKDGWPKHKDLMEMCIQHTQTRDGHNQIALNDMMKIAKVLVASGLPITQRQIDLASGHVGSRVEEKYALPSLVNYLERVRDGEEKPLNRKQLRQNGILFDPEKAFAARAAHAFAAQKEVASAEYFQQAAAREAAGVHHNPDALRAEDIVPDVKLMAPLKTQGTLLHVVKESQR